MGKAGDLGRHGHETSAMNAFASLAKEGQTSQIHISIPVKELLSKTTFIFELLC